MAKYDFPVMVRGDTFLGTNFVIKINGDPMDLTPAVITMDMRLTAFSEVVKSFTSVGDGGITIASPPTDGTFIIDSCIMDIPAGKYLYDIQIENISSGEIFTFVWGNWELIQDITYD